MFRLTKKANIQSTLQTRRQPVLSLGFGGVLRDRHQTNLGRCTTVRSMYISVTQTLPGKPTLASDARNAMVIFKLLLVRFNSSRYTPKGPRCFAVVLRSVGRRLWGTPQR